MGVELLRFDVSEYMEKHTVPPDRRLRAIGFDQGGLLTDGIDQHPHCAPARRTRRTRTVQHPCR
jgi:ATP-dependent Clp protease ATP-binding subunit ClpA